MIDSFIAPSWSAPSQIRAYATTRCGGESQGTYASFNLSYGVGDDVNAVTANRAYLTETLNLPAEPLWLVQKHGAQVVSANENHVTSPEADASFASLPNRVCLVATADCLPLLVCNKAGTEVAAIHAGWRGLAAGVIEQTLKQLQSSSSQLLVWLGPAIGPAVFEVGEEVREAYVKQCADDAVCFQPHTPGKWLANLPQLARRRLQALGVNEVYGGDYCTYTEKSRFFSYRRDGKNSGRMVSLIWINNSATEI